MNKLTEDEIKKMQNIGYNLITEGESYTRNDLSIYTFSKKKKDDSIFKTVLYVYIDDTGIEVNNFREILENFSTFDEMFNYLNNLD